MTSLLRVDIIKGIWMLKLYSYDMIVGTGGMGMVMLDDCNFHESVRMDDFDLDRTLTLVGSIWDLDH